MSFAYITGKTNFCTQQTNKRHTDTNTLAAGHYQSSTTPGINSMVVLYTFFSLTLTSLTQDVCAVWELCLYFDSGTPEPNYILKTWARSFKEDPIHSHCFLPCHLPWQSLFPKPRIDDFNKGGTRLSPVMPDRL